MNMTPLPKLLTIAEALEYLGCARSTWDRWQQRRVGPTVITLPNGKLRVRVEDLEAWLVEREAA
jgi:predicted site-specific integrase-resolvase